MSKRYWFAGIALGLVFAGLLFWPFVDAAVPRLDSLPQQTLAAPNCRYDEAVRAEQDAYRQTEAANKIPDARLGAGEGSSAYEAAKRGTEQAKECEERARAWSDLWAQWQSARAASVTTELTRWGILGTGLEILVLLAALAAASWAAWETRKANRIAMDAANNERPWLVMNGGVVAVSKSAKRAAISLSWANAGRSPAARVLMQLSGGIIGNSAVIPAIEPDFSPEEGRAILGQGTEALSSGAAFSEAELAPVFAGEKRLILRSAIEYYDVSGRGPFHSIATYQAIPRISLQSLFENGGDNAFTWRAVDKSKIT